MHLARSNPLFCRTLALALACAAPGCVDAVTEGEAPPADELKQNESRTVELEFLRFDAKHFGKTLTLDDLKAIPKPTLENTWLLDLDMKPMLVNVLSELAYTPPDEIAKLPQQSQNLLGLLNMTPANANLAGSKLESLLGVGKAVGLPASMILADLVKGSENDPIISTNVTADAALKNLVGTHPNARFRTGPVDPAHPDGKYPVTPGTIPVNLYDVVSDFSGLAEHYGPAPLDPNNPGGLRHPGFIKAASGVKAARDNFSMTVHVNVDALPYKGIDVTNASIASINSTPGQVDSMFDFSDPDWLTLNGLAKNLTIGSLTMIITEDPAFLPGGTSKDPAPLGNSPAWGVPSWEFEHLLATAGMLRSATIEPHCTTYSPQGDVQDPLKAVEVCIDKTGWFEIHVDPSVILDNPPPAPSYFWDVLIEVTQIRLHDGGIPEGKANLELTVKDVPVGIKTDDLVKSIKANLEKDPSSLKEMAVVLNDNADGDADFYYYQPKIESGVAGKEDYLYFIAPEDIRKDDAGMRVRKYAYEHPGFFADAELNNKVSSILDLDGDKVHEKVKIEPGKTLYMEDDVGHRYAIKVGDKPSPHRISLTLTRIK